MQRSMDTSFESKDLVAGRLNFAPAEAVLAARAVQDSIISIGDL